MGTTADKLNYLRETKKLIRSQLVLKGGLVTKETPFRSYAGAISEINVELPKLAAPSASVSDGVVTITNPSSNGNFASYFAIYLDGEYVTETAGTTVDLYDYVDEDGTYSLTVRALGDHFAASDPSTAVSVELSGSDVGYSTSPNQYGDTVTILASYGISQNEYGTTVTIGGRMYE